MITFFKRNQEILTLENRDKVWKNRNDALDSGTCIADTCQKNQITTDQWAQEALKLSPGEEANADCIQNHSTFSVTSGTHTDQYDKKSGKFFPGEEGNQDFLGVNIYSRMTTW